jgi:hypothetical protein
MRYSDEFKNCEIHGSLDEIAGEILAMGLFWRDVEF